MLPDWIHKLDAWIDGWCLKRSHNVSDLRKFARLRVPRPMFHYMDGAADDEVTLARNSGDFERWDLLPRYLVDVSSIDTSTTIMGAPVSMPVACAPTGMSRLFHNDGERAVAEGRKKRSSQREIHQRNGMTPR